MTEHYTYFNEGKTAFLVNRSMDSIMIEIDPYNPETPGDFSPSIQVNKHAGRRGQDGFDKATVNWASIGSQTPAKAFVFGECLDIAARIATWLDGSLNSEFGSLFSVLVPYDEKVIRFRIMRAVLSNRLLYNRLDWHEENKTNFELEKYENMIQMDFDKNGNPRLVLNGRWTVSNPTANLKEAIETLENILAVEWNL